MILKDSLKDEDAAKQKLKNLNILKNKDDAEKEEDTKVEDNQKN